MNPYHEEPYVEPEPTWHPHDETRCWCRAIDAVYVGASLNGQDEDSLDRIMRARHETERHAFPVIFGLDAETYASVRAAYKVVRAGMLRAKERGHGW